MVLMISARGLLCRIRISACFLIGGLLGIRGIRIMRIRGGGIMGTWDRLGGVSWGRDDVGLISCRGT